MREFPYRMKKHKNKADAKMKKKKKAKNKKQEEEFIRESPHTTRKLKKKRKR